MDRKLTFILCFIVGVLVFVVVFFPTYFARDCGCDVTEPTPTEPTPLPKSERVSCSPLGGTDQESCISHGCKWDANTGDDKVPKCFYPTAYETYKLASQVKESWGYRIKLDRNIDLKAVTNNPIDIVVLDIEFQTENRLRIKFYDSKKRRFEVPMDMPVKPNTAPEATTYDVQIVENPFNVKVIRKSSKEVVWDMSIGPLYFEDQFLQLSTRLPSTSVFGFGETEQPSFMHDLNWKTWGFFSRDQPPSTGNMYGVQPFYMCLENDFNAHGVLLLNSNAMDVVLQPAPALTYHTIGGVLDFYLFFGTSPENVIQEYTSAIGRSYLPPYWALGFQLSRYDYGSLDEVKIVVDGMRKYGIPHDIQYADIDYMERQLDFTVSADRYAGFKEYVDQVKEEGTRYITILDPAISANETTGTYPPYEKGVEMDVFIKDEQGDIAYGKVWPDYPNIIVDPTKDWDYQTEHYRAYAAFPDFVKNSTKEWWIEQIRNLYNNEFKFDGLWIDMNEPASFVEGSVNGCSENELDVPPYKPAIYGERLADKTLCMNFQQHRTETEMSNHYNMHSLYGWSQTPVTLQAVRLVTGKRSFVVTRSTYVGSGKYSGHWLGDNTSIWPHLHKSIIGMLDFSLFGVSYTGADICGFFEDTTEELCARWMQLGAFYPYSRNHNGKGWARQDPPFFGAKFANNSRKILHTRYELLPFLYTLHYESNTLGNTVVRPLLHEFTNDVLTHTIDRQFLWGPSLLISPVLDQGEETVNVYFPEASIWYDFFTGERLNSGYQVLDAPIDVINLHVRGGYILPTQEPDNSTMFRVLYVEDEAIETSRQCTFLYDSAYRIYDLINMIMFLRYVYFFTDTVENGNYYHVTYTASSTSKSLTSVIDHTTNGLMDNMMLDTVKIWGLSSVTNIKLDGTVIDNSKYNFNDSTKTLIINNLGHDMKNPLNLQWE
ncbi:maltase-glucoamylase, intestinal-like [Anneissia japonica]|uniref:maltase-glucoamylase, intestinal-like n=1 Tax=Anneissia japonica TaxID=1529436 RepID=UPI001425795C|nr:maltase-glucoamylase, intestinal-like [Anneissia japonica]